MGIKHLRRPVLLDVLVLSTLKFILSEYYSGGVITYQYLQLLYSILMDRNKISHIVQDCGTRKIKCC